ncbi:MAG: hypothetical protein MN733_21175 [Nitrososphaera sp.]|nr:hypothetical protein [Nitrososphaera sp.]
MASKENSKAKLPVGNPPQQPLDVDLAQVSSPALARIIEEVRNEEESTSRAYDRVHHRHNR